MPHMSALSTRLSQMRYEQVAQPHPGQLLSLAEAITACDVEPTSARVFRPQLPALRHLPPP